MLEKIRENIVSCTQDGKIYLLVSINNECGFFCHDGKVIFMVKGTQISVETVKTEKLSLSTGVHISSITNFSTFSPGVYDYIMFDGNVDEPDFENFVKICSIYSRDSSEMPLKDFFYSILEMFQLPQEQQTKNLVGLVGELCVLKLVFDVTGVNISAGWHNTSTDRYDFIYKERAVEVKTTTSELLKVKIKHDQLFGKSGVFLAAVHIINSNAGKTLYEFVDDLNQISSFSENLKFQVELGKELKRISQQDANSKKFEIREVNFYKNDEIPTIREIPENITGIEYDCILYDIPTTEIENVIE